MNLVRFGTVILPTDVALTEEEQAKGLMYRNDIDRGMSFVYSEAQPNAFWMKNTYIPLDIIFCRGGKVVSILLGEPMSERTVGNGIVSDLVVELPFGTAVKLGIVSGMDVELMCDTDAMHRRIAQKYQLD